MTAVVPLPKQKSVEIVLMTPTRAKVLVEQRNRCNRKYREYHARRISRLILGSRWSWASLILLDSEGYLQNGQHRLWAIIMADKAVEVILVYGVGREDFRLLDTVQLPRNFGDTVENVVDDDEVKYSRQIGAAVAMLCRWDRGIIENFTGADKRIEHFEIEETLTEHPAMIQAVENAQSIRSLVSPSTFGFFYYVLVRAKRADLATRMFKTLRDPGGTSVDDPFYQLQRAFITLARSNKRVTVQKYVALMIKACNYVIRGETVSVLQWRTEGKSPEPFPSLEV